MSLFHTYNSKTFCEYKQKNSASSSFFDSHIFFWSPWNLPNKWQCNWVKLQTTPILEEYYMWPLDVASEFMVQYVLPKDAFKDDFGGPRSMKIYRWRFKNLIRFWILVTPFIYAKLKICTFLLNWYHQKLIDESYFDVKIYQNSMLNWQFAKLWIILALKFSELLL